MFEMPPLPTDEMPPLLRGADVRHVVVVGLMGSGKTAVGSRLADTFGWRFDDSDASIEARYGRTVRELRDELGTDQMHELEYAHLLSAVASEDRAVVAPAASIVDVERCRDALGSPGVVVVWLRAAAATLAKRFSDQSHRPWYGAEPVQFLAEQASRRDPYLLALADVIVDVDALAIEPVATACEAALVRFAEASPAGRTPASSRSQAQRSEHDDL